MTELIATVYPRHVGKTVGKGHELYLPNLRAPVMVHAQVDGNITIEVEQSYRDTRKSRQVKKCGLRIEMSRADTAALIELLARSLQGTV